MPVIPSDFEYQFSPAALREVREQLGLSQAQLAKRLNLPTNTVSRWERGDTSPDANSLAAIYSIATGAGLEPVFFRRGGDMVSSTKRRQDPQRPLNGRRVLNRQRTKLAMMWDFQNVPLEPDDAFDAWFYMEKFLDIAFPSVDDWNLKVYAAWQRNDAVKNLRYLDVSQVGYNADSQIEQDIRSFCNLTDSNVWWGTNVWWGQDQDHDPKDTVLILVSKDGDFADLLHEADQAGVDVYLWAPPGCSRDLLGAARKDHVIPWNHPCIMVSEDNLRRLNQ